MEFIDRIRDLQSHAKRQIAYNIETEGATKTALVQPFINDVLGYDTRDITEVKPEFGADRGGKKDEKVDYAILKDGKPIILIECKKYKSDLNNEPVPQLASYFTFINSEEPKFAILTDGIIYRFYTDLKKENILDEEPFLEFDILKIKDPIIAELKNFSKPVDPAAIKEIAFELKCMRELRRLIDKEFQNPSEKFVKLFASQVHRGNVNEKVLNQFSSLIKKTLDQYIIDKINDRLAPVIDEQEIKTTKEELEGYYIVKTLLKDVADPNQVFANDSEKYFDVFYNDNNSRKIICRLYLNNGPKYIGLFDKSGKEAMTSIDSVNDIYKYSDQIIYAIKPPGPKSFVFEGQTYEVELWKDMLPKVCEIMLARHKDEFEKVLTLKEDSYKPTQGNNMEKFIY